MTPIEDLEPRRLMATTTLLRVGSVIADNRGEVVIKLSERAKGVNKSSVFMYTAGNDGKLYTSDDVKLTPRISYSENKKQITIRGNLAKDTQYRIKLDGKTKIKSESSGKLLDGEFNSASKASGNGKAGGNTEFDTGRDTTATPMIKMNTTLGVILIKMRGDVAPANVANFLGYVNSKRADNVIFHRGLPNFIVQGGELQITGDGEQANDIIKVTTDPALADEARVLSNTRGTISIAKSGPNTVTNQFFFNLADNSASLDEFNVGNGTFFTPFAQVTNEEGFEVIDAISLAPNQNLSSQITADPNSTTAVPVRNTSASTTLVPIDDLYTVTRTAVLMVVSGK